MKRVLLISIFTSNLIFAQSVENIEFDKISVTAKSFTSILNSSSVNTTLTKESIENFSKPSLSSIYNSLEILPSVDFETVDSFGLTASKGRIRGVSSYFNSITIDGFPNYGIRPIGSRENIYDLENFESISIYKGATGTNTPIASGNRAGVINLSILKPKDEFETTLKQSIGSENFYKTFLRVDSGKIGDSKFYISTSIANSDKFRGEGELGERKNLSIGYDYAKDDFNLNLLYNYNSHYRDDFMPLTYEQSKNLSENYYLDYQNSDPTNLSTYYGAFGGKYLNRDLMATASYKSFELKSYYSDELKNTKEGNKNGIVDSDRFGFIAKYSKDFDIFEFESGYWFESFDLKKYVSVVEGEDRVHKMWAWLNRSEGRGQIHSPYLQLSKDIKNFSIQGGVRYFKYSEPKNIMYKSKNSYSNYSDATTFGEIDEDGSLDKLSWDKILPHFGVSYNYSNDLILFGKYSKNYQRPYQYSIAGQYSVSKVQNEGLAIKLANSGKTLQDIFDGFELESSDSFDLGFRYYSENFDISPTLFYAKHKNLLFDIYDKDLEIKYLQNVGEAISYGIEFESNYYLNSDFLIFLNPSILRAELNRDLYFSNDVTKLKGNQMPETPKFSLKSGFIYKFSNYKFSSLIKYVGSRYADGENSQKVGSFTKVDLGIGYRKKDIFGFKELGYDLKILNLFNKKYIGYIGGDEDTRDTEFYPAPDRSFAFNINLKF